MASFVSTGSPRLSRRSTPAVKVLDENKEDGRTPRGIFNAPNQSQQSNTNVGAPIPLQSNSFSNLQPIKITGKIDTEPGTTSNPSDMDNILNRLRINDSRKLNASHVPSTGSKRDQNVLDKLLITLNDHNKALKNQEKDLHKEVASEQQKDGDQSSGSELFTPATDAFDMGSSNSSHESDTVKFDAAEMLRVKQELQAARSVINRQEQELAETRTLKHTMDQAMGPPSEVDFGVPTEVSDQVINHLQSTFNASARPFTSRLDGWQAQDEGRREHPEGVAHTTFPRTRGIWNNQQVSQAAAFPSVNNGMPQYTNPRDAKATGYGLGTNYGSQPPTLDMNYGGNRVFSNASAAPVGFDGRMADDFQSVHQQFGPRRNQPQIRPNTTFSGPVSPFGNYPSTISAFTQAPVSPTGPPDQYSYPQRGMGPAISPVVSDFPNAPMQNPPTSWSLPVTGENGQTYVTPMEPMNYRRLLDKSVSCDWKYIVDKIVCNNDQQASIFLQQKLKVGTAEQKFEIVESIVNQAYPLMVNRFGNFLVQRCFEHGTPEQVVAIAHAIHGNVLSLSMDPFGCHVIQKAFDSVPESHKADMVRELLRRIPDTVIHRYACHVWQKLFELRWSGEPPQIMVKVNDDLRGMWHEVALGETGSLVVQNIFENCVEEEKRPAIEEVITNIDLIAHGQFGNWCIQHLCEHGSPPDKRRVIDHLLANAYNYSIDQFASKVVEKCLKIGGAEFLDRYLGAITTARPDRPRIPLIDIAGDQYGNYLVQWILMNTHHHQREQVAIHIRKHMVSLRGSKFGSRVAMLCCNPNSVTRPGPGTMVNPFGAPGQPRQQWPRYR